jgi:ADP-ribosylglycohydrolase
VNSVDVPLGVLYGLALGDALGRPVEFMALPAIQSAYGPRGIQAPPDPALYTDDTQMTLALAEALIEWGEADLETLMQAVARRFIEWADHPDTPQGAPGRTCLSGVANLRRGLSWREAGVKSSKGCGSAMRVAAIGYYCQYDVARLREIAHASGFATHQHPAADAACQAAAYLVKLALDGVHPRDFAGKVLDFVAGLSGEFDDAIRLSIECLALADEAEALARIGEGWVAEEAVALALHAVVRHPDDYVAGVGLAANITGDSDSVACIAGGILGARLGLAAIPADWVARLENRDYIRQLADRLAAKRQADMDRAATT